MSKLFKLKRWVPVADAARRLGITFGEEVTEADVLRLALDGHLRLSIRFINGAHGKIGTLVPIEDAVFEDVPALRGDRSIRLYGGPILSDGDGVEKTVVVLDKDIVHLNGIYDLAMIGGERLDIQNRHQELTGEPAIEMVAMVGAFVEISGGQLCQLQTQFGDRPVYYPASDLPDDCQLVVMTNALAKFEESQNEISDAESKPLSTTERNTLLKLVIGMAMKGYSHDPAAGKSTAPKEIADDLAELGISISDDTVRKYLKQAADAALPAKPRQS